MKNKSARKILQNTSEETKQKVRDWADQQIKKAMKLIKLSEEYYIIVDDSEIKEGDFVLHPNGTIGTIKIALAIAMVKGTNEGSYVEDCKKITHSTEPLEYILVDNKYDSRTFAKIKELSLQEVKELIGEVDVENKMISPYPMDTQNDVDWCNGYQRGYNQAIEDKKDKKYTEEDMRAIFMHGYLLGVDRCNYSKDMEDAAIHYFQPQIQWEVTFDEQGKLRLV